MASFSKDSFTAEPFLHSQLAQEVIFIDRGVDDYEFLVGGVKPGLEVHLLGANAVAQMTAVLARRSDLKAVHVLSHGSPGCLYMGEGELSLSTLRQHEAQLRSWFTGYAEGEKPELLLYGCNVAAGDAGEEFLVKLQGLLNVSLGASAKQLGAGDWSLEYGAATHRLPLEASALTHYAHCLNGVPTDLQFGLVSKTKEARWIYGDFANNGQQFQNKYAFAALKSDGSVVTWGSSGSGGDSSSVSASLSSGVSEVFSTVGAFAALKLDGSVVAWGNAGSGGDSSSVSTSLTSGVSEIFSTVGAFAALKSDGSLVTWGDFSYGGDSSSVSASLSSGVSEVFSTVNAFAALKSDGSVVTWGSSGSGGDSSSVSASLTSGVSEIFSTVGAFAALKSDGSVVTWGDSSYGGNSSSVSASLTSGVSEVFSNGSAFVALKSDGSVVTWGSSGAGGDSSSVSASLISGVSEVFATDLAFAALRSDGSVVTWGNSGAGGDSSSVSASLTSGVSEVFSNGYAFAALRSDGSVITWGYHYNGGDSSSVSASLTSGVSEVFSNGYAFAALKSDGSVVTWGNTLFGGDSSSVSASLTSGVREVFSSGLAFAALKSDGSVVTWGNSHSGGDSSGISANLTSGVDSLASVLERVFSETRSIDENIGANSTIGTFRTTDPDSGDTFTYSLVAGSGDTDNSAFTIHGDKLTINASPNFEGKASYDLRVRTTDQAGATYEEVVNLAVNDLNDLPTGAPVVPNNVFSGNAITVNTTALADEDGIPANSFIYQWQQSSDGNSWNDISNASSASFTPSATLIGELLRVKVSYTDDGGAAEVIYSNATGVQVTPSVQRAVADFDIDGTSEILWRSKNDGSILMWKMQNNKFVSAATFAAAIPDHPWDMAGTADFDGDGQLDLIGRNRETNATQIWLLDVNQQLKGEVEVAPQNRPGQEWQIVGIDDFNGDDKADILWRHQTSGQFLNWYLGGPQGSELAGGAFFDLNLINLGTDGVFPDLSWKVEATGDFNDDNSADIVWRNQTTGQLSIWHINEQATLIGGYLLNGVSDTNWEIVGSGDYDGNGKSDLFWQHKTAGSIAIWSLDQGEIIGGGVPGNNVDPNAWKSFF